MPEPKRFYIDQAQTPTGELRIIADAHGALRALDWGDYEPRLLRLLRLHYGESGYALEPRADPFGFTSALKAYFAGDLRAVEALPTATGGTEFQRTVWTALREIPCGQTISYGELARRIGRPAAVRAVGLANGANPVGIVVPCHRVVGANGGLTGYGGGLERKRWLLAHEGAALL